MDEKAKILVIDDDPDNLYLVKSLLNHEGYEVTTSENGKESVQLMEKFRPDLVVLDINMPGLDGFETISLLRKKNPHQSVIFLTANNDTDDVIRGLEAGALDYICKPFASLEFLARIRTQLRVKKLQDELREANKKLQDLVEIDDLTGLFNMRNIYEKIDNEIERARRYQHGVAVIMLDMDHFKGVNDSHDHLFGSYVLSKVGEIIRDNIRSVDFAARYGGDEFLICLTHTDDKGAMSFAERLRQVIEQTEFQQKNDKIRLTASMGLASIKAGNSRMDARSLVRHADRALYDSKENGRNQITLCVFDDAEPVDPKLMRT